MKFDHAFALTTGLKHADWQDTTGNQARIEFDKKLWGPTHILEYATQNGWELVSANDHGFYFKRPQS